MKRNNQMKVFTALLVSLIFLTSCGKEAPANKVDTATIEKVKMAMLSMQRYSWEQGVCMHGLLEIGDSTTAVLMARDAIIRSFKDGRLAMIGSDNNVGDPGVNGKGVLEAYKITGDIKYKNAAKAQYDYFKRAEQKNAAGVIYHNNKSKIIFSDNMYMVAPFMGEMGDFDEAMHQVEGIRNLLYNKDQKLFHHIRTFENGEYEDPSFWGGGNGWCAAAMAQIIDLLPADRIADKEKLIAYCTELLDGCIAHQLPSGLLYDKIIEPNFEESTLPEMLAYTIYTGVRSGWLNSSYLDAANKMRKAVHAKVDEYGLVQGASAAPTFNSYGTSTEGQAFFLMMEGSFNKLNAKMVN